MQPNVWPTIVSWTPLLKTPPSIKPLPLRSNTPESSPPLKHMARKMTNVEHLLIRACKSSDPRKRVNSVYRRFYIPHPSDYYICIILSRIVAEYLVIRPEDYIDGLNPSNAWKYGSEGGHDYWHHAVGFLISKIRHSPADKFPELKACAAVRQMIQNAKVQTDSLAN